MPNEAPSRLRYDSLDEALGVGPERPRLSWRVEGESAQLGWEIESELDGTLWSSGRIDSGEPAAEYEGPMPGGGARISWRVRVFTVQGTSDWSDWAWWERGLDGDQWIAKWISPVESARAEPGRRPTNILRAEFTLPAARARARLHITSHGIYEAWLGTSRVGDAELTPGYTEYGSRLQVQTWDVTDQLEAGINSLTVEVSDGWYRGQVGLFRSSDQWGERTALLAQLVVDAPDGSTVVVATDDAWRSLETTHLADLIEGETIDLRSAPASAMAPGFDTAGWNPVEVIADADADRLVHSPSPATRRTQEIAAASISRIGSRQVVDFGQNLAGWTRISNLGPAGTTVTLTYAEALAPDGDVSQKNLIPDVPFLSHPLGAGQVDHIISDGDPRRSVETRHSSHGFRYVGVDGLDHDLSLDDITAVVVHTDLHRTGTFECSDESLNRLHEAAVWSFRGNVIDIPTDCPVRERAGWTGDWQIYLPTAAYLYDIAGFSTKWLRDVASGQLADGTILNQAPAPRSELLEGPAANANGSAGWGDAIVIVPWEQYVAYGDSRVLTEFWPAMVRWVDHVANVAETTRHESRIARNAVALPHEQYVWDTGFHWGEWLEPLPAGQSFDFGALLAADKGDVATAYYRHSTFLMSRIATELGMHDESARYLALSERIREAWAAEFIDDEGLVRPATQANCVRALAFYLVPNELRHGVAEQLAQLVRDNGTHLATGFLSTGMLLPTLADNGQADVAFDLLLQRSSPSWLAMIDAGATTVWERWEGWDADGMPFESHNHFSKGAVITFLHRYVAGIRPLSHAAGYRRFEISPRIGGGITHATGRLETPYGLIESSWTVENGVFRIRVVVPVGTTCRLMMPDGLTHGVLAGEHVFSTRVAA